MKKKTQVDSFATDAMAILQEQYQYISGTVVSKAIEKAADETAKDITARAPRDTGAYAESWVYGNKKVKGKKTTMTVYAQSPHYRLAHLIEFSHALRNGGRSTPQKHIEQPAEKVGERIADAIREELE